MKGFEDIQKRIVFEEEEARETNKKGKLPTTMKTLTKSYAVTEAKKLMNTLSKRERVKDLSIKKK